MLTTEEWAYVGQALVLFFAFVGIIAVGVAVDRGVR